MRFSKLIGSFKNSKKLGGQIFWDTLYLEALPQAKLNASSARNSPLLQQIDVGTVYTTEQICVLND